jgi:large subunit ribosomal protein L28
MSRVCKLTGKKPLTGHKVSHSQKKTRRRWLPNVQKRTIYVPELGRTISVKMSSRALRTVNKKGFMTYLKKTGLTLKDVEM